MLLKIKSTLKDFFNNISQNIFSGKSFRIIIECGYNQHHKYSSVPSVMLKKGKHQSENKKNTSSFSLVFKRKENF